MLIITGSIAYDYIMDFPGLFSDHILADKTHNINLSFIVNKFARRRGGTAGNVSYNLGLLDTQHILFSAAGKDFGEYKKAFKKLGIDTKNILIDKNNYTATGFAVTDKTDNQIWGYFYGAADKIPELQLKNIANTGDLVLIGPSGAKGSMSLIKQCIALELSYMFDPGFILTQINNEDLRIGVEHASYIVGNDYEINLIQSRISDFRDLVKDKIVITTFGKKGALIEQDVKKISINAVNVKDITDPTGAGDAWRAGFLAGLTRNYDLQTCGQLGSVISSYVISCYGTQEHKFTKGQFTKRYKDAYNKEIIL
jgi:adenosine kinase